MNFQDWIEGLIILIKDNIEIDGFMTSHAGHNSIVNTIDWDFKADFEPKLKKWLEEFAVEYHYEVKYGNLKMVE